MSLTKIQYKYPDNYAPEDKGIFYFVDEPEILPSEGIEITRGFWDGVALKRRNFWWFLSRLPMVLIGRKGLKAVPEAAFVTNKFSNNYFHWFNDVLPKLILLENNSIKCPLLLPSTIVSNGYVRESLAMLGWSYLELDLTSIISVGKMFVPASTAGEGSQHPVYFQNLCKRLAARSSNPTRIIFISRSDSPFRNVIPKEAFEQLLKRYAVELVVIDRMSLTEQISLFKDCSHLIAVHGAGLTNMCFMPANSKVLEIRRKDDRLNYCYFKMANVLGINYSYFLAEPFDISKPVQLDNFEINLIKFEEMLSNFLLPSFSYNTSQEKAL